MYTYTFHMVCLVCYLPFSIWGRCEVSMTIWTFSSDALLLRNDEWVNGILSLLYYSNFAKIYRSNILHLFLGLPIGNFSRKFLTYILYTFVPPFEYNLKFKNSFSLHSGERNKTCLNSKNVNVQNFSIFISSHLFMRNLWILWKY